MIGRPSGTILWSMGRLSSHVTATFSLARRMERRGHKSVYLVANPRQVEQIRSNGFDTVLPGQQTYQGRFRDAIDYVENGGLEDEIRRLAPDLVLADLVTPHAAFLAARNHLPAAVVAPLFLSTSDLGVPPAGLHRLIIPRDHWTSRLRIWLTWHRQNLRLRFREHRRLVERRRGAQDLTYLLSRRVLQRWWPAEQGKIDVVLKQGARTFIPQALPVVVLCPKVLDYPRRERANHHYIGPCLDLDAPDPAIARFPWSALCPDRKVVLCMLGDLVVRAPALCLRLWRALLEAVERDPNIQLVISAGRQVSELKALAAPPTIVVDEAPRLELLRRRQVALQVTHGGLNAIKQSLFFETPMLVCPFNRDQWANAGRVVLHEIGLCADFKRATPSELLRAIRLLLDSEKIRQRTRQMGQILQEEERSDRAVELLERFMSTSRRPCPSLRGSRETPLAGESGHGP